MQFIPQGASSVAEASSVIFIDHIQEPDYTICHLLPLTLSRNGCRIITGLRTVIPKLPMISALHHDKFRIGRLESFVLFDFRAIIEATILS
ncbi:MAG: hypothetical protein BWY63_01006 [Chloroflexi bacterium ADurb.Bin360]|nr:MAG: hypothetical protein BWY63_01006 [Chloroflexi bacterium ADurb.Bin360]